MRLEDWLVVLWAVYFLAVFTVGRFEVVKQPVIWAGGALVGLLSLRFVLPRTRKLPGEAFLLLAFLGWSAFAGLTAPSFADYLRYVQYVVELIILLCVLGTVMRASGRLAPLWWAFVATAVFNSAALLVGEPATLDADLLTQRQRGLTDNPNGLAFLCFLGVFGAVALLGDRMSNKGRVIALAGAGFSIVGMAAAGSRGAFLSFFILFLLWPVMCLPTRGRPRWQVLVASAVVAGVLYFVVDWILTETVLGARTQRVLAGEDTSAASRWELAVGGVKIGLQNPLFGVGLGNFGVAFGTGQYAHNEFVEVFATTGFPGLILIMALYWSAWRRLTRAVRAAPDPLIRYRMNVIRILVIILVVAGAVFRPNLLGVDTMFLITIAVGYSHWAFDRCKVSQPAVWRQRRAASSAAWRRVAPGLSPPRQASAPMGTAR